MKNKQRQHFYLLGEESQIRLITLPDNKETKVVEFLTLDTPGGGNGIAIFLSRLDAQICCQYLNQQSHNGKKNKYVLIDSLDSRVAHINEVSEISCNLVLGFLMDMATGQLIVQGGCYSMVHFRLQASVQQWLLKGGSQPHAVIMNSFWTMFAKAGDAHYLDELTLLETLDETSLAEIARNAVLLPSVITASHAMLPVVFSPSRQAWIPMPIGGQNEHH